MKLSLRLIGFYQALGLTTYCSLVAILFWQGNQLFGRVPNYLGPFLFLILLVVSALICAFISLAYPIILFWEKKQTREALKLIGITALWLLFFLFLLLLALIIF